MTEYVKEYGKRWDARVPRYDIAWLMRRLHVSTTRAEIESDIRKRCTDPGFNETLIKQSIAYAMECHKRNRALFDKVQLGRL